MARRLSSQLVKMQMDKWNWNCPGSADTFVRRIAGGLDRQRGHGSSVGVREQPPRMTQQSSARCSLGTPGARFAKHLTKRARVACAERVANGVVRSPALNGGGGGACVARRMSKRGIHAHS